MTWATRGNLVVSLTLNITQPLIKTIVLAGWHSEHVSVITRVGAMFNWCEGDSGGNVTLAGRWRWLKRSTSTQDVLPLSVSHSCAVRGEATPAAAHWHGVSRSSSLFTDLSDDCDCWHLRLPPSKVVGFKYFLLWRSYSVVRHPCLNSIQNTANIELCIVF